jgi:hypothetical protein
VCGEEESGREREKRSFISWEGRGEVPLEVRRVARASLGGEGGLVCKRWVGMGGFTYR